MKKLAFLIPLMVLLACGTYKTFTVARLQLGMTKADVEQLSGDPTRILAVTQTEYGCQEILEYKTDNNEIYALEFMNDHLVRYEFLSKEVIYFPPPPPLPPYPVIVVEHPNHSKPVVRPAPKPSPPPASTRPDDPQRPAQENSQTKPPARHPDSNVTHQSRPSESTQQVKSGESDKPTQKPSRRSKN